MNAFTTLTKDYVAINMPECVMIEIKREIERREREKMKQEQNLSISYLSSFTNSLYNLLK